MTQAPRLHRYRFAEYVDVEQASTVKHEFLEGEIYAMAGGTPEHAALAMAVGASLLSQLRGRECRVYSSDLRVRVLATGLATYPDVTVVCGPSERDPESRTTVTNPKLVVEVTSDATEDYDRGEKIDHYQRIPSLAAIVLVSHREQHVEVFERHETEQWRRSEARQGAVVSLAALRCTLSVDEIYAAAREPEAARPR